MNKTSYRSDNFVFFLFSFLIHMKKIKKLQSSKINLCTFLLLQISLYYIANCDYFYTNYLPRCIVYELNH